MIKYSDAKSTADIEYLSSAIVRDAMTEKFRNVFGLDPVQHDDEPAVIAEGKVPENILASVDPNIATVLKASAVEESENASGSVPDIESATLLYTILNDEPASIALDAVAEYQEMDSASRDATVAVVAEQDGINIEDGVAYLSQDQSGIEIGIFVDNQPFAEELSHRVENAGGDSISHDEKMSLFDELVAELPGGDNNQEEGLRNSLLAVVGLTEALPESDKAQVAPEDQELKNPAPGPQPEATDPQADAENVVDALNLGQ